MALITEKSGQLWLVDVASGKKQAVSGVPAVKVAGQGGLGDVVAHPGFAGNQRVYLSFAEAGEGETSGAALGYGTLRLGQGAPRIEGFKVIWRQAPKVTGNGHFAHRIAFAPDGTIFLSSGERQKFDPAQAFDGNLGKILHLTAEGQAVPGGAVRRPRRGCGAILYDRPAQQSRARLRARRAAVGDRDGPQGRRRAQLDRGRQELRLSDRVERQPL